MPELAFSLAGPDADILIRRIEQQAPPAGAPFAAPRALTARWRDSAGEPVGEEFPVTATASAFVEYAAPDGNIANEQLPPTLSFSAELPAQAAALDIRLDQESIAIVPAMQVTAAAGLPPPRSCRFGTPAASFVVPVFAERFTDEARFVDCVRQLHSWVTGEPPFDDPAVAAKLAFDAHFWVSDPVHGLFGTDDSRNPDERLFYGDRELARRLLAPWANGRAVSLILIDSTLRGGAGGQPGYSAWTSITGKGGERWEAVCLHEVGHGLGLADEYLDEQRAGEWPSRFEPNIARDPRPSKAPWKGIANVGDTPAPTMAAGGPAPAAGTIGTFEGARYRTDLYRASADCLMKDTKKRFCAVCQRQIRKQLGLA